MKNLIEKIELKVINLYKEYDCNIELENFFSAYRTSGKIDAYNDVLQTLNQYNIITAPKSIMLSEIVDRLKKALNNPKNKVNVYRENENEIVIKITYFARGTFVDEATIEMTNKIWDIDGLISARYKWLYTLWIAGTEIIDDMESDE